MAAVRNVSRDAGAPRRPVTHHPRAARQTHWFRVGDGKLTEHWATREDLPAMLRLGVVQPPGRRPS